MCFLSAKGFPPSNVFSVGSSAYAKMMFDIDSKGTAISCDQESLSSQRLIVSLEDDFNIGWILYRVFGFETSIFNELSPSNYQHLLSLHDSLPCGIGGVHLSASILFSESDLGNLRENLLRDFLVTATYNGDLVDLTPIITYDGPTLNGINYNLVVSKFGNCCAEFQDTIKGNFVFGPNLDAVSSSNVVQDTLRDNMFLQAKYPPVFVAKHFGLERTGDSMILGNTHHSRVILDRSEDSLIAEWNKLASWTKAEDLGGIMVSHVFIDRDEPMLPLVFSERISKYQKGLNNLFTVSDSLDMAQTFDVASLTWPVQTDFVLWVNFYSGRDFLVNFVHRKKNSLSNIKVLEVKRRLGLIELNGQKH